MDRQAASHLLRLGPLLLAAASAPQALAEDGGQQRPNIMVILLDDLGYTDISPFGGEMHTPPLESMANSGVRMKDFYVTPRCSNTRVQMLTGLQSHVAGLPNLAGDGTQLPQNHVFIPEVLQASGYHTYMSGKWHLGRTDNFGNPNGVIRDPRVRGFDHYYGFTENHSQDMFDGTYHLRSDGPYAVPERQYTYADSNQNPGTFYQTDAIGDYALDFLANNRLRNETEQTNDPFFTYVAFGAPHFPLQARDEWIEEVLDRNVFQKGWDQLRVDHYNGAIEAGIIDTSVQLPDKGWVPQRNGNNPTLHEIADWDSLPADRQAATTSRL